MDVRNTLTMLALYTHEFSCRVVVFTSTPAIIDFSTSLGHTVITNTRYNDFPPPHR